MQIDHGQAFTINALGGAPTAKPLRLRWVPPGSFTMGAHPADPEYSLEDGPAFSATLSTGFWLAQYPTTQAQWLAVMATNPSHFHDPTGNCPVENVSWHDAMWFCAALNGLFAASLPPGYQFSLPTEMQWEYACRAGTTTLFSSGDTETDLARIAWYVANSAGQTHPVGEKEPNAWGFYDMHGNIDEWCYDAAEDYPPANPIDRVGTKNPLIRALRGGSYGTSWNGGIGCACRGGGPPDIQRPWIGFRLCLRQQ